MSILRALILLVLLACATAGCSMSADTTAAEVNVDKFHAMLDAGQFTEIYAGSSAEMKKLSTEQATVTYLTSVHSQLGAYRSSKQQNWRVNYDTKGSFITLTYKTTYAAGDADEQFIFLIQAGTPALYGYKVSSPLLK
ncbi:MAG TPA: DUF4019 domain-containing protein [Xanthomonadaceae bacterium]|jgi:hypothetical protein|nr:DUF4019 domain-containing protein [Xanthomonadaceae bacterium]